LTRTEFLLGRGVGALLDSVARTAAARPRAFAGAVRAMLKMGWRSQRGLARHGVYLAEACLLRELCAARGITHLHVHHATNPAAVALLCHLLGGPRYSMTIHGPEEFEHAPRLALNEKMERAAFVVTVSEWSRQELLKWCDAVTHRKIHVVRNGVNEMFVAALPTRIPDTPRLLWIGRLVEQKDPLLLVRAVDQLRAEKCFYAVTMIGDGALRAAVAQEIARRNLQVVIVLKGWANRAEILNELRGARALVLSSRAENVPSVILEAMTQERPVISTNVGGVGELIREGETGWLVPPDSELALARAMRRVLEMNATQLAQMGCAGRKFVLENFDVNKQAAELQLLFSRAEARPQEQ
jgi:glycosyltransferase involved in cell wall biosynthesis